MSDIVVDTYKLRSYAARLGRVNQRLTRLDWRLKSLYSEVGLLDLYNLIRADLIVGYNGRLAKCQSYLALTAEDFDQAESNIAHVDPLHFVPPRGTGWLPGGGLPDSRRWREFLGRIMETVGWGAAGATVMSGSQSAWDIITEGWELFWSGDAKLEEIWSGFSAESEDGESFFRVLTATLGVSAVPTYGSYENDSILGDKDHLNVNVEQTKKKYKQVGEDEKWYDKEGTILEIKDEVKLEGSVLDKKASGEGDWAKGSIEGKILTGEMHASASAGLYAYSKDEKTGETKRIFSPGVEAEIGASAAVFQLEGEGRIGLGEDKNLLGVYGDTDIKALSGEAKAKFAANRNEVYLGASAEADLVKASATAGVSVLGTDVGVSGSVKVGVGAHAEVGYTDGKLKLDIGAAVGVGFDLGLEVDVSGTVDAVCGAAVWVAEGVGSAVGAVADGIGSAWNWIFGGG